MKSISTSMSLSGQDKEFPSVYVSQGILFDLQDVARWFDRQLRISYIPGDVYFTPEYLRL
ncbi:MAG: hypothetical protein ACLUHA_08150 [Bacteroides stercoris]